MNKGNMKKSSTLKKIVVKSLDWSFELDVDSEMCEDILLEAATRIIEKNKRTKGFKLAVIMECFEKKNAKVADKHYVYNTYYVMINAGLYEKAEQLRSEFKKTFNVDLKTEPLYGQSKSNKPRRREKNN
jgi:hypothetical protein